jgi:hypothetical protein
VWAHVQSFLSTTLVDRGNSCENKLISLNFADLLTRNSVILSLTNSCSDPIKSRTITLEELSSESSFSVTTKSFASDDSQPLLDAAARIICCWVGDVFAMVFLLFAGGKPKFFSQIV